ncbi:YceD family protein [Leptolyngbya ohadii]|uniref:YceD family protein n=1 Tax=Leptolyngbya ohadii TaxID=1962290 RepID=UPI000B5A1DF8|nr:YceD family protein [Leptolyngbya ohadii]
MERIYIPQLLKAVDQAETIPVREHLPELETLTPVQGVVRVSHRAGYLEVSGKAEAIVTLTCDRCLQQYNHRLTVDASEVIWLQEPIEPEEEGMEYEVAFDDLVETLPPNGFFEPATWLYEQFCLALPPRQLCDKQCQGIQVREQGQEEDEKPETVDRRWASLEALRNQLPQ